MKTSIRFRNLALSAVLAVAGMSSHAQSTPANSPGTASAQQAPPWTTEQICTCTIRECWTISGKNETSFFDIVGQLAVMSAQKRGLTLPNDAEAGRHAGEYIKQRAKADPDALLCAVVDEEVRRVGK